MVLFKEIYERLFTWIINRINEAIANHHDQYKAWRTIGILDIYGFEIFEVNRHILFFIYYGGPKRLAMLDNAAPFGAEFEIS